MRGILLLTICTAMVLAGPIFGGDDHDQVAHQVIELTKMLREKNVDELRKYCVKLENYVREEKGDKSMGGVHDYVFRMDEEACTKYILGVTLKHKELLDLSKFTMTVEPSQMFLATDPEDDVGDGGLDDFIFRLKRRILVAWAFSAEKFVSEQTGKPIPDEGIKGRIKNMSEIEIGEFILDAVKPYPQLNSFQAMTDLAILYGFEDQDDTYLSLLGGLKDTIYRVPRETLMKWAVTCERHHRLAKNISVLGGLEDYVQDLSNEELIDYILTKTAYYTQLDSAAELDRLAEAYKVHIR